MNGTTFPMAAGDQHTTGTMRNDQKQPFEHVVQFYEDDEVICGAVTEFLLDGQALGEFPVLLSTSARRPEIARHRDTCGQHSHVVPAGS